MPEIIRKILSILDGTPTEYGERRQGQSLVEMIFIIPILIIMVIGTAEIGWLANNYLNLMEAAKVGARRGPFLSAENGPIAWDANNERAIASVAPPHWPDQANKDISLRYRAGLVTSERCNLMDATDFGFYNLIACTVIDSLDPLEIRNNGFDDIVISAFSLQRVNIGDPATGGDIEVAGYDDGPQVVVTGRWPSNANECDGIAERDPFDWIADGQVTSRVFTFSDGRPDIRLAFEMYRSYDRDTQVYSGYLEPGGSEKQRGFAWTGQRQVEDDDGNRIAECFGSTFDTSEVEELMNLPNFIEDSEANVEQRRSHIPSQGMVLVELYWRHDMIFNNPVFAGRFSPIYWGLGGDDPNSTRRVLQVWAAFPAPDVEPAILFEPPADD